MGATAVAVKMVAGRVLSGRQHPRRPGPFPGLCDDLASLQI